MSKSIIVLFSLIFSLSSYCQTNNDSIKRINLGLSHCYTYNGKIMTYSKMTTIMKDNVQAFDYLKKAKTSNTLASIVGFAGGFCMVYPIAKTLSGQQANWTQFAIGCGLTAVYIPLVISTNKNLKLAVDTYNRSKVVSSNINEYELKFMLTQNGLGLILKF